MSKSKKRFVLFAIVILIIILLIATIHTIFFKDKNEIICNSFSVENCPNECVICPPCDVCSSISCQTEEFCNGMGFNREWYEKYVHK